MEMKEIETEIGAAEPTVTTLRATTAYPTPTATEGAAWPAGARRYDGGEVQNGRRKVQMNPGGSDYWVPLVDVSALVAAPSSFPATPTVPPLEIRKDPPSMPEATKGALSSWFNSATKPAARSTDKKSDLSWLPLATTVPLALGGIAVTIALLAKRRWGWAAANFFLFTPLVTLTVGVPIVAIMQKRRREQEIVGADDPVYSDEATVRAVQQRLIADGAPLKTVDGKWGPDTAAAIKFWMKAQGSGGDGGDGKIHASLLATMNARAPLDNRPAIPFPSGAAPVATPASTSTALAPAPAAQQRAESGASGWRIALAAGLGVAGVVAMGTGAILVARGRR